jgi:serine/threonine-protein kinase
MIGETVAHYRIIERLGSGGMGVVYKAADTRLGRLVALKFLPDYLTAADADKAQLLQEAKAASILNHPHVCGIHSIGEHDGRSFIDMEFVEGETLGRKIAAGPLDVGDVVSYATQAGEALLEAHAKGVIHRDIKPENLMVNARGQIKVMDFGLAKLRDSLQKTRPSTTAGTFAYLSPEQIQGSDADARSDIFAFGVVMFQMITGRLPFRGDHEAALLYSIVNEEAPPIERFRQGVPPHIARTVERCLEKNAAERYQSFAEVLEALKSGESAPRAAGVTLVRTGKRNAKRIVGVAALGLVSVIAAISLLVSSEGVRNALGFASVPEERHLVVLPFTSIGGDSANQPLCDGLVETITSKLTQLEQFHGSLWVVPSSEVRRYGTASPGEAYQSFRANLVVTGNLQLLDNAFRLTLNLIDAQKVRQISSTVLDITEAGVAGLQDKSVTRLLEMLDLELGPNSRDIIAAGGTAIPHANEEYLKGLGYLQRYDVPSNLDAAIDAFRESIELDSKYALAYAGLGEASWRKYEASKEKSLVQTAVENCETAYRLRPELPRVAIALGLVHAGTGENDKAIEDFRKALEHDPGNDAAYRGLAKAHEAKGNLSEAESTYKRAVQLKPDYWAGHNDLGVFYYRKARYEEAASEFQEVVRLTPDNFRAYSNAGGIFYMLNRLPEAQRMFESSLAIRKTYPACSNLATLYYVQGLYAKAARMYEEALALNDGDSQVWGNLGAAYYWAPGEREKALAAFQRAIKGSEQDLTVNPNDVETMAKLAGYYAMVGETAEAEAMVKRATSAGPENALVLYLAGTTYEQLGNREKALYWVGRALERGYSLSEVEQQPELKQLLADKRFADLKKKSHERP